jgi:hypothetical protein
MHEANVGTLDDGIELVARSSGRPNATSARVVAIAALRVTTVLIDPNTLHFRYQSSSILKFSGCDS